MRPSRLRSKQMAVSSGKQPKTYSSLTLVLSSKQINISFNNKFPSWLCADQTMYFWWLFYLNMYLR